MAVYKALETPNLYGIVVRAFCYITGFKALLYVSSYTRNSQSKETCPPVNKLALSSSTKIKKNMRNIINPYLKK